MTLLNNINMLTLAAIIMAAVILIVVVVIYVRYLRKTADARKIRKIIGKYSEVFERDVILSDGMDGYLFIDYLIPVSGEIIAMNIHEAEGYVFGGDKIDLWTQVVGNKSTKFNNPLENVNLFVQQASNLLKFDGMTACVMFGSKSEFPKGKPEGALSLASFEERLSTCSEEKPVTEASLKAWEKLLVMVAESRESYSKE